MRNKGSGRKGREVNIPAPDPVQDREWVGHLRMYTLLLITPARRIVQWRSCKDRGLPAFLFFRSFKGVPTWRRKPHMLTSGP